MDQRDETPPRALARGGALTRDPALPPTLLGVVAAQIARAPERRIWSMSAAGPFPSRTHGALWVRSAHLATALAASGAGPDRPVVLLIRGVLDFVPAFWAGLRVGATLVPLTGQAGSRELGRDDAPLRAALARLDAPVVLHDDGFADWAAAAPESGALPAGTTLLQLDACEAEAPFTEERPCAEPCCLVATSGSTGQLKLVALSQETILNRFHQARPKSPVPVVYLSSLPIDGISGIAVAFHMNREVVHVDLADFATQPLRVLDAMETLGVTHGLMTSSLAAYLLKAAEGGAERRWNLGALQSMGFGAEPVVPAVMRRLRALFARHGAPHAPLSAGYGTTETGALMAGAEQGLGPPSADADPADLGPPAPGVALRVVDPAGAVVAEGELGEVEALCPQTLFSGYRGEPEATRAAFTADGWYRTGDLGIMAGGRLTLHGRAKDVLITNGRKLSLAEIDAALQAGLDLAVRAHACAVHWPGEESERLVVVLAAEAGAVHLELVAAEAAAIVGRRFGLAPGRVVAVEPDAIPLTGAGKIRRRALADDIRAGRLGTVLRHRAARPDTPEAAPPAEQGVPAIWRAVLAIEGPLDAGANFFDLGGDSLRALALATRIGEAYGGWIAPEAFFADPTLATLVRLVSKIGAAPAGPVAPDAADPSAPLPWPLPDDLRSRQLSLMETWAGTRPTRDRLVAGLNVAGGRPPLFWVFQVEREFRQLARHLGPDQPLYGFRSGSGVIRYDEDEIQRLALRYVHEIVETCPEGPVLLGGNCQGALIAQPVAQHLLRRGRHVPLLVLMEWGFAPQPYGGRVIHLYGRDSLARHPDHRYRDPERMWRRLYRDHRRAEIPGAHAQFFRDENVGALAETLTEAMARALAEPPLVPVRDAYRVDLAVADPPARMAPGESRTLAVKLRNAGPFTWDGEAFGLSLRSVWVGGNGEPVAVARGIDLPLPLRAGGEIDLSLAVTAPEAPGAYDLVIDLADEGWTWAPLAPTPAFRQAVTVAP
ncbi:AMP-binding protein [Methylorubrum sp. SB2]|uniref:AMP-binding protein n=1 Tax=Methylorubrum subtropicum TaxID=3138812 RepID=UPI00313EA32D